MDGLEWRERDAIAAHLETYTDCRASAHAQSVARSVLRGRSRT